MFIHELERFKTTYSNLQPLHRQHAEYSLYLTLSCLFVFFCWMMFWVRINAHPHSLSLTPFFTFFLTYFPFYLSFFSPSFLFFFRLATQIALITLTILPAFSLNTQITRYNLSKIISFKRAFWIALVTKFTPTLKQALWSVTRFIRIAEVIRVFRLIRVINREFQGFSNKKSWICLLRFIKFSYLQTNK
jgi:hypothetical protein